MATPTIRPRRMTHAQDQFRTPQAFTSWALGLYSSRQPPILGTVSLGEELENKAKEKLETYRDDPGAYWYVAGSAGSDSTHRANRAAFDKWKIIPRMLVNATNRRIETTIFGVKYPSPIILAPIGVQGILHADAELASARAAAKVGVPFTMSTASTRSIELVAQASGNGPRWYQLYWPRDNRIVLSLLNRAKSQGFTVLVVTLDTMLLGFRPHDIERVYLPFIHSVGAQVGFSDPVFMSLNQEEPTQEYPKFPYDPVHDDKLFFDGDEDMKKKVHLSSEWMKQINSGVFRTWDEIKFVRDNWEGPLVLKGIQSVEDAELSFKAGVDGIIVSNHGGRQVDGAISSLAALENIMASPIIKAAQSEDKLTILFDSGIRTGSDVIKALALGAQAVLLGRPYAYGLAIAGEDGVEHVVRSLLCDLEATLGLSGYSSIQDIQGKGSKIITRDV
ncbi:FMN-dependent alpha-hydroxy acid dehydrogenase [Ramaria rubella]|nr:FMN-dependent alpha-hydroxy acid dehydrogenase [Ramaria rubella]